MARFLSVNTTYNPMSMDEMLKIPLLYNNAYEDKEKKFQQLSATMADYEQYARMYPDSEASKQYLNFVNDFNKASDDFYTNGLSSTNRNALAKLHRDYNKVSKPFKTAVSTYNTIMTQRQKDYKNDIIGNDVDFNYILQHPEYNAALDKESYITGKSVYNTAKDLFKGLSQFDNTPVRTTDGVYNYIEIPQSYTQEDIYTAFTGEGNGRVTPELQRAVDLFKQQTNYNMRTPEQQEKILLYGLQGAITHVKPNKVSGSRIPQGKNSKKGEENPQGGRSIGDQGGYGDNTSR
jgi:hypothetical protein